MMTMKEFRLSEARRLGLTPSAIAMRIKRGRYQLKLKRVTAREIYVLGEPSLKMKQGPE